MDGAIPRIDQAIGNGEKRPRTKAYISHPKTKAKPYRESVKRVKELPQEGLRPMCRNLLGGNELTALGFSQCVKEFRPKQTILEAEGEATKSKHQGPSSQWIDVIKKKRAMRDDVINKFQKQHSSDNMMKEAVMGHNFSTANEKQVSSSRKKGNSLKDEECFISSVPTNQRGKKYAKLSNGERAITSGKRFGAATLVGSPHYPNAIAWSNENLVAVASGHLITILKPATTFGPRGIITLAPNKPFPIGVIDRQDLLSPCLLTTCLAREVKPCVRSISWSPIGFAPNAGCLLAVCTTEGYVKVYRMPYSEFSPEWIEVMDISEMLYTYLASVNFFEEPDLSSSGIADHCTNKAQVDRICAQIQPESVSGQEKRPRRKKALTMSVESEPKMLNEDRATGIVFADSGEKCAKQATECCNMPLITAEQFVSRSAMLSSLIVAWSPILSLTTGVEESSTSNIPGHCSLLAVAGKSGRISFWRFDQPPCYTNMNSREPISASLVGFLQAHDFWLTALSWELFATDDASNSQLLLATGSSNGSVKIWKAYASEVMKSSETNYLPFHLLEEIVATDSGMVSVLSLIMPLESPGEILLAIGRGSGSLEVWIGDINSGKFEKDSCSNAHEHILTGLAWAFGGSCLYSCSQDGTIRSWILRKNTLSEAPFPSNIPGVKSPSDVPDVYDLCFGLAISPGNLAMAVVHSFDSGLLNPMYEARIQKAVVEFLWIGGQQQDLTLNIDVEFEEEATDLSKREQIAWEHNILWSFKQYDHWNKPLVIWDIVAALLAFGQTIPNYVGNIILQWMRPLFGSKFEVLPPISSEISKLLSNVTSRQLNILNIIGRRVFLKKLKVDQINNKEQDFKGLDGAKELQDFWLNLVGDSEKELRERLWCLNFSSAILRSDSSFSTNFVDVRSRTPVGLGQMMQWVAVNCDDVRDRVKSLAEEVGKIKSFRFQSIDECVDEERCSFCSAVVPFKSPEVAFCEGVIMGGGDKQRHKLARCAASMLVCPDTPTWFCICCHRNALHLAPPLLFSMPKYPSDSSDVSESRNYRESTIPLCPFCGVLLQRRQPEFLLSPSPV